MQAQDIQTFDTKEALYEALADHMKMMLSAEKEWLPNLSNASALIWQYLSEINWAGFYVVSDPFLLLGPFQGKPACVTIAKGMGVCGTTWAENTVQLVPNVHEFPGHIACDGASNSEIVLPIRQNGEVVAVLDIDSPIFERFDNQDQIGLENLVSILETYIDWTLVQQAYNKNNNQNRLMQCLV